MASCGLEKVNGEDDLKFHLEDQPFLEKNTSNTGVPDSLLTREDLFRLDAEEPIWRRVRIILLAVFWILWIGLLAASITIILLSPRCPPVPKLSFWQSKVGYWVDPFAFADSGSDLVGDLKGLVSKIEYIKDTVGAGFIILGSFVSGQFTNQQKTLGLVDDFMHLDPALGSIDDFRSMIKSYHRSGLEVVLSLDFNAVSHSHPWTKQPSFLQKPVTGSLFSRSGSPASITIDGADYYSVGDEHSVDLDLTSAEVVRKVTEVVNFWLKEGADGIMLVGTSFYVEDDNGTYNSVSVSPSETNKWFTDIPSKQLFAEGSVQFVHKIRQVVDEVSSRTSKPRLLAVDAGDCGYGLHHSDDALRFLGTEDQPAAHLIVSRQFVRNRGWKVDPLQRAFAEPSLSMYDNISQHLRPSLALTTATPSDQRHNDILALAATFLLPGSTLVYYGTELLMQLNSTTVPPADFYPRGKSPFPNLSERDSALVSHLPMPWDRSGFGFSGAASNSSYTTYMEQFAPLETVESASSFGRGETGLTMVQKLVKLRQNPGLLWGEFKLLQLDPTVNAKGVELFVRKAEGYPTFIIAFIKATPNFGSVFSFSDVCSNVILRFTYPVHQTYEFDKAVDSSRIYLSARVEPAVYVFECA